ncbi:GNAT family N-acetyltransferase [Nocardia sp. NRRL S-836]|uniref:GNAT family N-acetyltransferase n=1 Tax=Nocardia sp. NRRL S-836 TaxID=1519492 RepID=UPI0006AE1C78|nr:GNAT family N-acetyltransferase [Nocardia sp. NRRL S-836]
MTVDQAFVLTDRLAEDVAAVTRRAYRAGDLVPGLPVADGAKETAQDVRADLAAGYHLWTATAGGRLVGAVRAHSRDWCVRRLAVSPDTRGLGVGKLLLRALEAGARAEGAARVVLDAVVERGNPAFYARAGYRTVHHFPADDKPLSEVHMELLLGEPVTPRAYPELDRTPGTVRSWWSVDGGTVCATSPAPDGISAEVRRNRHLGVLRGVDLAPLSDGTPVRRRWPLPAAVISSFALPRLDEPEFLAWWRVGESPDWPSPPAGGQAAGVRRPSCEERDAREH